MSERQPNAVREWPWWLALLGVATFVTAIVSLSGPGRMDIIDADPRYEIARSLVEHGDFEVRDPGMTWFVLPGRDGRRFSAYRWPQSVVGAVAIALADATGPISEMRRQFFFTQTSAAACGLLAISYAVWFHRLGYSASAAIGWAVGGIFCTPNWFFGTSSFDDILGTAAIVTAVAFAWPTKNGSGAFSAMLAGLSLGFAINCKQPLGIFALPVVVATWQGSPSAFGRQLRTGLILLGLALGIGAYFGYEWYKFPPETTSQHAALLAGYVPAFFGNPVAAIVVLAVSPAAGVFWYNPALFLSIPGCIAWWRAERRFTLALLAATAVFVAFLSTLHIFKGDLSWGPRYLTPVFALFWVFVPAAAAVQPRRLVALCLGMGVLVQVLGLSIDFHRLYVERGLPSGFYYHQPWIYFEPAIGHLVNRPREIIEVWTSTEPRAPAFSPCKLPTAGTPCPELVDMLGSAAVRKYHFLNSFRPWWASMWYLPPTDRPVDLLGTAALLIGLALSGALMVVIGVNATEPRRLPEANHV